MGRRKSSEDCFQQTKKKQLAFGQNQCTNIENEIPFNSMETLFYFTESELLD